MSINVNGFQQITFKTFLKKEIWPLLHNFKTKKYYISYVDMYIYNKSIKACMEINL